MNSRSSADSNNGWAVASLVFGLAALLTSFLLVGILFGMIGVLLGMVHLFQRQRHNIMAGIGMCLSVLGAAMGIGFGILYYQTTKTFINEIAKEFENIKKVIDLAIDFEQWKGVPAPEMVITPIDGPPILLSDLKGKRVVLAFWDTTSESSLQQIADLNELRKSIPAEQLVIIGFCEADAQTLKDFVKQHNISYPVAQTLDLLPPFDDVTILPTTVHIDRNGIIQDVIEDHEDLALLKTRAAEANYSGAVKTAPETPQGGLIESADPRKLVLAWSADVRDGIAVGTGDWDADGKQDILVSAGTSLQVFHSDGHEIAKVTVPASFWAVELGRHPMGPRILGYPQSGVVSILDTTGKKLWDSSADGVASAHWCDLDGDGIDEVIVGFYEKGGLKALSADGQTLWQYTEIDGVNNLSVIPGKSADQVRIVATDSNTTIKIFDGKGKHLKSFDELDDYFENMAAVRESAEGPIQIIATDDEVVAIDDTGNIAWTAPASETVSSWRKKRFDWGDMDGDGVGEWAFIDITGDMVLVTPQGEKFAALPHQRRLDGFAIVTNPGSEGLLITLRFGKLRAYKCD